MKQVPIMSNELNRYVENILANTYCGSVYDNSPKEFLWYSTRGEKEIALLTLDNYRAYHDAISQLYQHFFRKDKGFSKEFLESMVQDCLFTDNHDILSYIEKELNKNPIREFLIIRPLYGVSMKSQQISRAGYKFISSDHFSEYWAHYSTFSECSKLFRVDNFHTNKCYVEIKIEARDSVFAKAEADKQLQTLDNILRVLSQSFDKYAGLGVFNYNTELVGGRICYDIKSGKIETSAESLIHPLRAINLDELILADNELWEKRLWSIYEKETLTWSESRIKKAVNWIGYSINERDLELSFLQSLFALESLLQCQSGFIDKGLTAQMAENFAFIVANTPEDRVEAEKQFKKLYRSRSELVHGGSKNRTEEDRDTAVVYALATLEGVLSKEEFLKIKNEEEFKELITHLKFGLR